MKIAEGMKVDSDEKKIVRRLIIRLQFTGMVDMIFVLINNDFILLSREVLS